MYTENKKRNRFVFHLRISVFIRGLFFPSQDEDHDQDYPLRSLKREKGDMQFGLQRGECGLQPAEK